MIDSVYIHNAVARPCYKADFLVLCFNLELIDFAFQD